MPLWKTSVMKVSQACKSTSSSRLQVNMEPQAPVSRQWRRYNTIDELYLIQIKGDITMVVKSISELWIQRQPTTPIQVKWREILKFYQHYYPRPNQCHLYIWPSKDDLAVYEFKLSIRTKDQKGLYQRDTVPYRFHPRGGSILMAKRIHKPQSIRVGRKRFFPI